MLLINDLLDSNQISNRKLRLNPETVDLIDICTSVTRLFSFQAKSKGVSLSITKKEGEISLVKTDQNRVRQIMTNLLGNALKFTERGSIEIVIEKKDSFEDSPLLLSQEANKQKSTRYYEIQVKDSGIGIEEKDIEHLFTDYSTNPNKESLRLNKNGIGLGLVISQKLVEALNNYRPNSKINVTSIKGKGSVFSFPLFDLTVPDELNGEDSPNQRELIDEEHNFKRDMERNFVFRNHRSSKVLGESEKIKNILIADDDPLSLAILESIISQELPGYSIDKANNGAIAVDLICSRAGEFQFYDMIILDGRMPLKDGLQVAIEIKSFVSNGMIKDVPVILLSGDIGPDDYKEAGFVCTLMKPVSKEHLLREIKKFLI